MTPIFGPTTTTQEQAFAWARKRGAHERAFAIIPLYYQHAPRYGIPAENALGQSSWETNDWKYTGQVPPEYHNMAGIKTRTATGDKPEDHQQFYNAEQGVIAHLQHLARYGGKTAAQLPDPIVDPRFTFVTKFTDTMEGLGGAWAPAASYGQMVVDKIDELKATAQPMTAQLPGYTWVPADSRHYTPGRFKRIQGGAQHYTAGTNSLVWLTTSPNSNVSATCLVKHDPTMEDRGWQLVRIEDTAHTTGATINPITASIEYEQLDGQAIPDIAYEVLGATWADIERYVLANGLGDFSAGIKGHKTWVGDNRVCPDGIDMARVVERWQHYRTAPAPPADDALYLTYADGTKCPFPIVLGFRAWCEAQGRARGVDDLNAAILSVTGYPSEPEWLGKDGRTYQRFERLGALQYTPGNRPPFDVVPIVCGTPLPDKAA